MLREEILKIVERIVRNDIYCCASTLIYELSQVPDLNCYDELIELWHKPDYETPCVEAGFAVREDENGCYYWESTTDDIKSQDTFPTKLEAWQNCVDENDIEPSEDEVLEHWIVSDWLVDKLRDAGETVGEIYDLNIWGRTCSGQAISMDSVMCEMVEKIYDND